MTRNPPSMTELGDYVVARLGPQNLKGVVADEWHFNGYHLGPEEVPYQDYSMTHPRDIAGAKLGNYATAIDIGMAWVGSREWLAWVIKSARDGRFPDLVEINGSVDGRINYYLHAEDGFSEPPIAGVDHVGHSHLGFYRDSVYRSQLMLFRGWDASRVKTKTSVGPKPTLIIPSQSWEPSTLPPEVPFVGFLPLPIVVGLAGLAWALKRRRDAGL